ncbi:HK97 family phage prohead protease [Caballeronia zhejiangensis]|jgi:HK97 family phage prohead protease|uniref:HK97 family phage prohead protease n=1 Tax=Caballeronia zhejiangensis TaxID=871203 RepID=UPI001FD02300|nr:HK97 family phage prohead protease [Caballeronia zhejiangensis]
METKAFSAITIKTVREERREIEGMASTPALDRVKDQVDPMGLQFAKEVPLLLNHDHASPVGTVTFGKPTAKGLPFKATIAKVDEPGTVQTRTNEAWHSVKSGLIKGVSLGFRPIKSEPNADGGINFKSAEVHELSLVAIPANPEAFISAFKSLGIEPRAVEPALPKSVPSPAETKAVVHQPARAAVQINHTNKEVTEMQNTNHNIFIRRLILRAMTDGNEAAAASYAEKRWGAAAGINKVLKAVMNPLGTDNAAAALASETLDRDRFVQAVFSNSILGQLQGLTRVPALARVNVETAPISASFVGEHMPTRAYQGAFGVTLTDKRKVGLITVLSAELIRMSGDAAEAFIAAQLQRALSRGLDNAFLGSQARDEVTPAGLGAVASQANSLGEGLEAFTGDLTTATVLVNPLTAVRLRSASETQITARGGIYGGMPAICSYSVPVGKLFVVDASRVLAFLGTVELDVATAGMFPVDDGTGTVTTMQTGMFQTNEQAIKGVQYADWSFVDGAAFETAATVSA